MLLYTTQLCFQKHRNTNNNNRSNSKLRLPITYRTGGQGSEAAGSCNSRAGFPFFFFSFDSFDDSFDDEDDPEAAFAIFTAEGLMSIRVPRRVPL